MVARSRFPNIDFTLLKKNHTQTHKGHICLKKEGAVLVYFQLKQKT